MRPLSIRSVLVASDLSDALVPVVRSAAELAHLAGARLHIVHATEHDGDPSALGKHIHAAGLDLDTVANAATVRGPPGAVIIQEANRTEADVIVLGPHRIGQANVLGSTADRVVRGARAACLILPRPLGFPFGEVLAPVDVTESSRGSLAVALTWASAFRQRGRSSKGSTRLVALHIIPPGADQTAGLAALNAEVAYLHDRLAGLAGVEVQERLQHGDNPADLILQHAETNSSDLVVLSTRAEAEAKDDLLGSVSAGVVRRATAPVLLVPPAVWQSHGRDSLL